MTGDSLTPRNAIRLLCIWEGLRLLLSLLAERLLKSGFIRGASTPRRNRGARSCTITLGCRVHPDSTGCNTCCPWSLCSCRRDDHTYPSQTFCPPGQSLREASNFNSADAYRRRFSLRKFGSCSLIRVRESNLIQFQSLYTSFFAALIARCEFVYHS